MRGLQQISDTGGTPQPLTRLENGEVGHAGPEFLPGGKAVLFAAGKFDSVQIAVQSIETGKRRNLIPGGLHPRYALSGHLLYAQAGNLMAVPFDFQRLVVTGPPSLVVEDVFQAGGSPPNTAFPRPDRWSMRGAVAPQPLANCWFGSIDRGGSKRCPGRLGPMGCRDSLP